MNIRLFTLEDLEKVRKLHELYFFEEFEFPNFVQEFLGSFIIEENNEIILVAGVRPIAELVAITDMSKSVKSRVIALKEATKVGMNICRHNGLDQLHCFVQGDKWARQVQTINFRPTKGKALVIDVG